MKKIVLSILAVLMLVRAEPAQALSWIDLCTYASKMTTTLYSNLSQVNAPKLIGGALILYGLTAVLLSLKKDKVHRGDDIQHPRHA